MSPVYRGPADHLVFAGQIIPRGSPVEARGKALDYLKSLGHFFDGHEPPSGPVTVAQPTSPSMAMGADGGPITPAEVLASSRDHIAAQHEAALQETQAAQAEAQPEQDRPARGRAATANAEESTRR